MQTIAAMNLLGTRRPPTLSVAEAQAIQRSTPATTRAATAPTAVTRSRTTADADGAIAITEKRAARRLPAGRYRYRTAGRTVTVEVGEAACSEGRKLRLVNAAQRAIAIEKAIRDKEFGHPC